MHNKRHLQRADDSHPLKKRKVALIDDPMPVRTVQVKNTVYDNNEFNGDYLRGYFEGLLGPVSDVTIANDPQDGKHIRTAYVTFVMPEDAARSISEPNHKFAISEAERVFQPKLDPNAVKFEGLNDDCLRKIVSYLDLIDIVNLGKSSKRCESFTKLLYQKNIHFSYGSNTTGDSSINKSNLKPILEALGRYIQSVVWYNIKPIHLKYLSKYCSNVIELTLKYIRSIPEVVYQQNAKLFTKLEKLEIEEAKISNSALKMMTSSNQLKHLQLHGCNDISGEFFTQWNHSKIETLKVKIIDEEDMILCNAIFDFVRKNNLVKFSYNGFESFGKCLTLPSVYLCKFEELDLNYEDLKDNELGTLNFKDLKQLRSLRLNCWFEMWSCCNKLLMAVSQIPALTSLTICGIIIDNKTLRCLGSIKSLRKIYFENYQNDIGGLFYSALYAHMPAITNIGLYHDMGDFERDAAETSDLNQSICAMIKSISSLRYFGSSSMTWKLLDMILQVQLHTKRPLIEIGVSSEFFDSPKKQVFQAAAQGIITLSVYEQSYFVGGVGG